MIIHIDQLTDSAPTANITAAVETEINACLSDGAANMAKWLREQRQGYWAYARSENGTIVGAACVVRRVGSWYHEGGVWVTEEFRRNDIGTTLISCIRHFCEMFGVRLFLVPRDEIGVKLFSRFDPDTVVSASEIAGRGEVVE